MSLGETLPPGIGFGKGWKGSRAKSDRRALIMVCVIARQTIGDIEVSAETIAPGQIRALRRLCMDGSPLAEDCAVALGELVLDGGDPDDNVAMATDRVVDAINARVRARNKET